MEIGEKLELFLIKKCGSLKSAAEALGKSAPDLSRYLGPHPTRGPGSPLLKRVYELGCDMNWLFNNSETGTDPVSVLLNEIETLRKENRNLSEKINRIERLLK